MKFKTIKIKQFRGILEAELIDIKQFNIILGKNNAFKTTLLEAIFTITGMSNPLIPDKINSLRGLFPNISGEFRYVFHNLDYNNYPEIEATFDTKRTKRKLKITPEIVNSVTNIQKTKLEDLGSSAASSNEIQTTVNGLNLDFSYKTHGKKIFEGVSKMTIKNENVTIETNKQYVETLSAIFVRSKQNISEPLEKIIVEKRKEVLIDILKEIEPSIRDISLGNNSVYIDIGADRLMPINLMGDGIIKILSLLVTIYESRGRVILIDEIGNGLHYSAITTLWKGIFKAAKEFDVQLFITTHNREILNYLNDVLEQEKFREHQNNIMIHTVRKLENNILKSYNYGFDALHHAIEYDNEIR